MAPLELNGIQVIIILIGSWKITVVIVVVVVVVVVVFEVVSVI